MPGHAGFTEGRIWAVCDRCGIKREYSELRKEWTGLMVGPECFDPRPPELTPPYVDPLEGTPVKNPRGRTTDTFIDSDVNPVDPNDL